MTSDMHSGNVLGNPCVTTCDSFKTVATGVNKIVFVPRLFPFCWEHLGNVEGWRCSRFVPTLAGISTKFTAGIPD